MRVALPLPVVVVLGAGQALTKVLEALAAVAAVFVTVWLLVKGVWWVGRQVVRLWRTSLTTAVVLAWLHWWGSLSLLITLAVVTADLLGWRLLHRDSFEPWAGRYLRAWWQRWMVYARRMPRWLRACGLTVADQGQPVTVQITPFRRTGVQPRVKPRRDQLPRVVGVRSGPSWDEVRVRLVPGQTPEDFDEATRALAVARGVARCQVRELAPDLVSIDFQRRNLLADLPCPKGCTRHASRCPQRQGGGMVFRRPKGKSRRVITLPAELVTALRRHRALQNEERLAAGSAWEDWDLVFCQPNGRPIDPRADWAEWGELLQRAGVRQMRLHDGRHTAATLLLEQGVHVRAIQRILGHSDVRTTEAYTHVGDQMTRDAARRMGAALWGE